MYNNSDNLRVVSLYIVFVINLFNGWQSYPFEQLQSNNAIPLTLCFLSYVCLFASRDFSSKYM